MTCPKCNSENVNVQAVSIMKNKRGSFLYFILIGWFIDLMLWIFLTLPMLIFKIFRPKKIKTSVRKMAICQSCGYSWKV